MSIKAVAWLLDYYDKDTGSPTCMQFKTMVALAEWSDSDFVCFPSIASIARRLDRTPRQAKRVLSELAERGDIAVVKSPTQGRGQYNRYLVHCDQSLSDLEKTLSEHERIARLVEDPKATARSLVRKRDDAIINAAKDDKPEEKPERLTPENFTPEVELQMLLSWGRIKIPKGFDPQRLEKLQTEVERTTWRIKESHKQLICLLRYVTNWGLPISSQRSFWAKTFEEHLEMFRDPARIAHLYAMAYARLKQQQGEAEESGRTLTLVPQPSTLTKTMSAINQEMLDEERKENSRKLSIDKLESAAPGKTMEETLAGRN